MTSYDISYLLRTRRAYMAPLSQKFLIPKLLFRLIHLCWKFVMR